MPRISFFLFSILFYLCSSTTSLSAIDSSILNNQSKVTVDLQDPIFKSGVLSTTKGGVIYNDEIRIQAQEIAYHKESDEELNITKVTASGDIIVELNGRIFVGDSIEYNFTNNSGVIFKGKTRLDPWFIGGEEINLASDGTILIKNAFISTSENLDSEWQIGVSNIRIRNDHIISAKNVNLRVFKVPVFWLPAFKTSVKNLFDTPLKLRFRWDDGKGPRVGVKYRFLASDQWQASGILEYSLKRGWGGGVDSVYENEGRNEKFKTNNYIAYDKDDEQLRYRFRGIFEKEPLFDDKTTMSFQYDRLSDDAMASDYHDKEFDLKTAGRTELSIWHKEQDWFAHFLTRLRINPFQTIKQELPSLEFSLRPFNVTSKKLITENRFKASYLNLEYEDGLNTSFDHFDSIKISTENDLYRNFKMHDNFNITPNLGFIGAFYGNSPSGTSKTVTALKGSLSINSQISKKYGKNTLHSAQPYIDYQVISKPSTKTDEHFIFDVDDAIGKLNQLSIGLKNNIYKYKDSQQHQDWFFDIYAISFFDTPIISKRIPYLHTDISWTALENIECFSKVIWNFNHNILDRFNLGVGWTHSEDLAAGIEYRHRSKYSWRKAVRDNYTMETIRSEDELLENVSDKNDTLLTRVFYRFAPNWDATLRSRHGWNRPISKKLHEYQIDISTFIRGNWKLKTSYLSREEEQSISMKITLPKAKPDIKDVKLGAS